MKSIKRKIKKIKTVADKEHKNFCDRHLKNQKDPTILILKSHLYIENILDQILKEVLPNPKKLLDKKFSEKIDIFEALNISPNITEKLRTLNKIRNKFSHNLDYNLTKKNLEPLIKGLKLNKKSKISILLNYSLGWLTGYLTALKCINSILPFLSSCANNRNIFDKDPGFDFSSIIKAQYPDDSWKSIFDELKIKT